MLATVAEALKADSNAFDLDFALDDRLVFRRRRCRRRIRRRRRRRWCRHVASLQTGRLK